MSNRILVPALMVLLGLGAVAWAVLRVQLPPADFTFVNETEVKSLDWAAVTGIPEHRLLTALYEGLTRLDAKALDPLPGAAESWDISKDKKTYTFHLRKDGRWSNGKPVTAHDFIYSLRRFLDPLTGAEYAYQAWYIKNARRYTAGADGLSPGDAVEVEMNYQPAGALPFSRGEVLRGKLVKIEGAASDRVFVVEIDGKQRRFRAGDFAEQNGIEPCRQVLLDFREVGIRAIDDRTLVTELEHPTPYWLSLLAYHAMLPMYSKSLETFGTPDFTYPGNIVTNGAYTISFRRIRDRIRLVKNEYYWDRDRVKTKVIDALAVPSQVTMFNLYETDKADWIPDAPTIAMRELLKPSSHRTDLDPMPYMGTYFYACNLQHKPLNDMRVRKALALAIDRDEITKTATGSGELPAYSFVPPGIPDYKAATCGEENVKEAQRLLAEAGFPNGVGFPKLEILYNTHEAHQAIAQLIRKQWEKNLGIEVTTRNEEWGSYQSSFRAFQYDIARRAWIGDYRDPNTFLDCMVTNGENNCTGWSNAEYDKLIAAARSEVDEEKRMKLLERAERILMDELPVIPIYYYVDKNLVKPYVRGFYRNALDNHPLSAIWIDREQQLRDELKNK